MVLAKRSAAFGDENATGAVYIHVPQFKEACNFLFNFVGKVIISDTRLNLAQKMKEKRLQRNHCRHIKKPQM